MQKWLEDHNIVFDQVMIKAQLYELIKLNKDKYPKYVIDELAKSHGHQVVLEHPPTTEFNAEELMGADQGGVISQSHAST